MELRFFFFNRKERKGGRGGHKGRFTLFIVMDLTERERFDLFLKICKINLTTKLTSILNLIKFFISLQPSKGSKPFEGFGDLKDGFFLGPAEVVD
jgi:hypothetical protein